MTSKTEADIVGISSFNNSETIASSRLWRRKVVTSSAASSFRTSGSLAAACSAIRRRLVQLNRQLGLRCEIKNNTKSATKNPVLGDDFSAIHELIQLVGNVTFFDVLCRLTVKDADVIQQLGILLEYPDLRLDIATSIIRLFGNLCESKESAASVLQTKPCVRVIVVWLKKNLDDDSAELDQSETKSTCSSTKSDKNEDHQSKSAQFKKLREQCIRSLKNAASCGQNFAQYLVRTEAVFAVGRCVRYFDDDVQTKAQFSKSLRRNAFQFLHLLLPFKDHNFSEQILRADILEKLMKLVVDQSKSVEENIGDLATKLILGMITHYSSLRTEFSKFGAIEWTKERIEKSKVDGRWSEEIFKDDSSIDSQFLIAFIRFCRDAYTRSKLRESRALDLLLDIFINGELKETKFFNELMSAFLCFLYDDQGLKYLVEYDRFLVSVVRIIDRFTVDFPCLASHLSIDDGVGDDEDGKEEKETNATVAEDSSCEFRADSPSYKRFRLDPNAAASTGDGETASFEVPLCKDFTNATPLSGDWSSPSNSPFRNPSSPSSPGPAWSPSASSLHSLSSIGSSSPTLNGNKRPTVSCWSPTSDGYRSTDDLEYDWVEFDNGRRYSTGSHEQSAPALCECEPLPIDEMATYKDRERLLWAAVKLLSWLSHSVHAASLVNEEFLTIFLNYLAGVCRPEPRIGRLIERLTRNRLFTESLVALKFYEKVNDTLCFGKCEIGNGVTKKKCGRCRKLCKIGCGIINSFRAQVDTDFGFGTLEHMMAVGDVETKVNCLCTMRYLMKSNWRVKRLMSSERGGFDFLIQILASNDSSNEIRAAVAKAICAGIDKDALRDRFLRWSTPISNVNRCNFPSSDLVDESNRVTFSENGGEATIDCDMKLLMDVSPFYRAMFSGSYTESTKRRFVYDDGTNFQSNFTSFVFYVHFLHGCRNCDRASLNSPIECLSVLELADKRLCLALAEFVVNENAARFLRRDNLTEFISNSILRRDLILYKISLDFLFAFGDAVDLSNVSNEFRQSDLSADFFQMLCDYAKNELL